MKTITFLWQNALFSLYNLLELGDSKSHQLRSLIQLKTLSSYTLDDTLILSCKQTISRTALQLVAGLELTSETKQPPFLYKSIGLRNKDNLHNITHLQLAVY